jgi:hypothetical protein
MVAQVLKQLLAEAGLVVKMDLEVEQRLLTAVLVVVVLVVVVHLAVDLVGHQVVM